MKTTFIAILILMMSAPHAVADTCTRIIKCEICQQEIKERYECADSLMYYGGTMTWNGDGTIGWYHGGHNRGVPDAKAFSHKKEISICPTCHEKHESKWSKALDELWKSLLATAIEAEAPRRLENIESAKERKIDKLRDEVRAIEKRIKEALSE